MKLGLNEHFDDFDQIDPVRLHNKETAKKTFRLLKND